MVEPIRKPESTSEANPVEDERLPSHPPQTLIPRPEGDDEDQGEQVGVHQTPTREQGVAPGQDLEANPSDNDSAIGDDTSSSSITDYHYENGRRYHAYVEGRYHLPNDEEESDRLDLQHHLCRLLLDGNLYCAPLKPNIQSALDIGTGTGIWAIEFAEANPSITVIGTDISPIQPSWVPPNVTFLVDDAESDADWEFGQEFDYIHLRFLTLSMRNWPRFFRRCFTNLKPGGWIEVMEFRFPFRCDDGTATPESPVIKWSEYVIEAASRVGIDRTASTRFPEMMQDAGFTNVQTEGPTCPVGPWRDGSKQKRLGKWTRQNTLEVLNASMAYFTRMLQWSREAAEVFFVDVRKDLWNPDIHAYLPLTICYAQKPEDPEPS